MNGIYNILACAYDVNLTGDDIGIIERNEDVLIIASNKHSDS